MIVQKGQLLTEDDSFLVEWARESKKANLSLANDVLGKLLGTTTAFVGGGVVFLNKTVIPQIFIAPTLLLLLLSLALAFIGVLPYQASVNVNSPTEIDKHKTQALNYKLRYIKSSAFFFLLALLLTVGGVIYRQFCD